jgi:hypothetical protein
LRRTDGDVQGGAHQALAVGAERGIGDELAVFIELEAETMRQTLCKLFYLPRLRCTVVRGCLCARREQSRSYVLMPDEVVVQVEQITAGGD